MRHFTKRAIKGLFNGFGYKLVPVQSNSERWPNKSYDAVEVPTIFIFTPPNSGSTAISKLLTSSERISSFNSITNEMQWLIPGLCEQDRWFSKKAICYESIAGTANLRAAEIQNSEPNVQYFVEKSPPNMVRHKDLLRCFPNRKIVINNREPLANIASQKKRYSSNIYHGFGNEEIVRNLAELWIFRSKILCEIQEMYNAPVVTYEDFCDNPIVIFDALNIRNIAASKTSQVRVKDYASQSIVNMNAEQKNLLSDREVEIVCEALSDHSNLLKKFNYTF